MGNQRFRGVKLTRGEDQPATAGAQTTKTVVQYKQAKEVDKARLAELCNIMRKKLTTHHQGEWHRRRGREKWHTAFIANLFGFTKKILG